MMDDAMVMIGRISGKAAQEPDLPWTRQSRRFGDL
jgi:hypothetical protein